MSIDEIKSQLQAELPALLQQDAGFRCWLEDLIRRTAVPAERFDDRFDRVLRELAADREEQSRKWDKQDRQWEEQNRKWEEQNRKWHEENRKWEDKWEEQNRKWEEQNRKWHEENRKWEEQNRKSEEHSRKWEDKWEEQNCKWEEQNRKWHEQNRLNHELLDEIRNCPSTSSRFEGHCWAIIGK